MSTRKLPISNTMHQPKLMQQQTISFHNQPPPTIIFGGITHHITPDSIHMASRFKTPKANSYSQPSLPVNNNNKAAPKHADSEKSSAPRIQHDANNNHAPSNRDSVSKWLATSQEFEKPPAPAPVADPALPERHHREYWLEISKDLDLRLKARSEEGKAPNISGPSRAYAEPVFDRRFELDILKIEKEKLTPRNERNASANIIATLSPVATGPRKKLEGEGKKSIEASISEFEEKLERRKLGPRTNEQLERVRENKVDETVEVNMKQLEVAKSKEADDAVRAKEKEEHFEAAESKKADDAVRAKEKEEQLEVVESKKTDDAVRAREKEEQFEAAESKKADDAVRAKEEEKHFDAAESWKADDAVRAKEREEQFEITESKKTDDAVRAKEKEEHLAAAESKKADDAVTVRAKAKKLAADAIARHKEEQERKKYVEGRARDIHENMLRCGPFDIDAVRREFSEKEVRDIKEIVRALGFAKMR